MRGCRARSVAQIAGDEALFANQEKHDRSAQSGTPGGAWQLENTPFQTKPQPQSIPLAVLVLATDVIK